MEFNLLNLILVMFLTGLGSFGGGMGAVNILKEFLLNSDNGWLRQIIPGYLGGVINEELELFRILSITQYSGYSQGVIVSGYLGAKFGIVGVILSVLAFVLPSVLIVIILLKIGEKLFKNENFKSSLKYINLLTAGFLCVMVFNYMIIVFNLDPIFYMAIAGLACFANIYLNINPVFIVLAGGIFGAIFRA